jgi:branched-chain amino acid transport system substrate-binding protein
MSLVRFTMLAGLAAALACGVTPPPAKAQAAAPQTQYFPLQSYRVGPYAAGGSGFFGGFIDYMNLVNLRDGGINGVRLTWSECETQYVVERGVECYQRLKNHVPSPSAWNPLSVGIAYAMIPGITADQVSLITIDHGRTDSTDGAVFPYVFPLLMNPYSESSAIVNFIATQVGGSEKLADKSIVVLYHGSPYGRETIPIYQLLAKKFGFRLQQIEVPDPGTQQESQWLQIRRIHPDYVVLRGWGVMNPVALKTAQATGFPANHIIGNVWSNSEEDARPAGSAAKGYIALTTQATGTEYPVIQQIENTVYGAHQGDMADKSRIGSVYYNLGVVNGIFNVEAVRIAQTKFGKQTLTGEQIQWGFEHLDLDPVRVAQLGATGLFRSINVTCADHEGHGYITFQQWDGASWHRISDWIAPDWALLRPIIVASAERYAAQNKITPRDCSKSQVASN